MTAAARWSVPFSLVLIAAACGDNGTTPDGGVPDTASLDGGRTDGASPDGGSPDSGDGDGGHRDASSPDSSTPDGGTGGTDSGRADAGSSDAGVTDTGVDAPIDSGTDAADTGPGVCVPAASNMRITEVMVASEPGGRDRGEWFEIQNLGDCPIDLTDLVIAGTDATHTVPAGVLAPGGPFVFAQSANSEDNHDLPFDAVYTGIMLPNGGGELTLRHAGSVVDQVSWTSTDHRTGTARQLDFDAPSGGGSLGASDWCDAREVYSMSGGIFLGTPGATNEPCR